MPAGRGGRAARARSPLDPAVLASLAIAAATLFSCGMETVEVYDAPSLSYGGYVLTLTHDTDNSGSFLGYEIYYRAYGGDGAETKAESDRATIQSLAAQDDAIPDTCIDKLSSLGFERLKNSSGKDDRPLFKISADTKFYIYLSSDSDWYYNEASDASTNYYVSRWISETDDPVSFIDEYVDGDDDYYGTTTSSGSTVYFVFFAVAYGFDISTISNIYSVPASTYTEIYLPINY